MSCRRGGRAKAPTWTIPGKSKWGRVGLLFLNYFWALLAVAWIRFASVSTRSPLYSPLWA